MSETETNLLMPTVLPKSRKALSVASVRERAERGQVILMYQRQVQVVGSLSEKGCTERQVIGRLSVDCQKKEGLIIGRLSVDCQQVISKGGRLSVGFPRFYKSRIDAHPVPE